MWRDPTEENAGIWRTNAPMGLSANRFRDVDGMRKIVNCWMNDRCLVALCEDGTLWTMPDSLPTRWYKLPAIPGDDEYATQVKGWTDNAKEVYAT